MSIKLWGPAGDFIGTIGPNPGWPMPSDGAIGCLGAVFSPLLVLAALVFLCNLPQSCAEYNAKETVRQQQRAADYAVQARVNAEAAAATLKLPAQAKSQQVSVASVRKMNAVPIRSGTGVQDVPEAMAESTFIDHYERLAWTVIAGRPEYTGWGYLIHEYYRDSKGKYYMIMELIGDGGKRKTLAFRVEYP